MNMATSSASPHEGLLVRAAVAVAGADEIIPDVTPLDSNLVPESIDPHLANSERIDLISIHKTPSLHNQPTRKTGTQYDTLSLSNQPRRSARVKGETIKRQLLSDIKVQAQINATLHNEINQEDTSFARYEAIKKDLEASKRHVHKLYNEFRVLNGEPCKAVTQKVDKLTHDNDELCNQISQIVSSKVVRPKTSRALSRKSRNSAIGSQYSCGTSCSTTSSILRQKQAEANARLVELEMQLHANSKTQAIQEQLTKLENAKKAIEIESQIEAEK